MEKDYSRRDFLKVTGAAALVVATAGCGLATVPTSAFADASTDGTYTVTANVYVDKADTPIGQNAYVTNNGNPPLNKPTSPVYNNATLVIKDGKKLLTVPIVNNTFGIYLSLMPRRMVRSRWSAQLKRHGRPRSHGPHLMRTGSQPSPLM